MHEESYTPDWCGGVEFFFYFSPEEKQTYWDPGCPAEVEFTRIKVHGVEAKSDLEEILFESVGDRAEEDILVNWAKWKEEERAEYLYEQHQDRLREVI